MQKEERESLINLYLSIQNLSKIFNEITPSTRPRFGEDIVNNKMPSQKFVTLFKKHNLKENKDVFIILAKLLIQCYNNPDKVDIESIDLNTDFNYTQIETCYENIASQIAD